jgi:phage tail-like protein
MSEMSSFLKFLPPVLWDHPRSGDDFHLGQFLLVFEKLLTGLDDGVVIGKGDRRYSFLQDVIARNYLLYQPWTTPDHLPQTGDPDSANLSGTPLEWLAQWVALRFPPDWKEYQRRKAVSEIVQIHALRGTKAGLNKLLDLYAISDLSPRIVIDDASKILFTRPQLQSNAPIHTLVSQQPLIAPRCVALGKDGFLYVGDRGSRKGGNDPDFEDLPDEPSAVWRVSRSGEIEHGPPTPRSNAASRRRATSRKEAASDEGRPRPLGDGKLFKLTDPVAIAVDNADPWGLFILDGFGSETKLYRLSSPNFNDRSPLIAKGNQLLSPQWPVGMIIDHNGDLLILDRGSIPPDRSACRILKVEIRNSPPLFLRTVSHGLEIVEPMSLMQRRDGTLIVGDAGDQGIKDARVELWSVDPAQEWSIAPLLDRDNPLVAPSAIVEEDFERLLVLDIGLRPYVPDVALPFNPLVAQQAAVYSVDFANTTATGIRCATETRQLVYPCGMVRGDDGTLYLCDSGMPDIDDYNARAWRSLPNTFAAVVHFPGDAATNEAQQTRQHQLLQRVRNVLAEELPVQSHWKVTSKEDRARSRRR